MRKPHPEILRLILFIGALAVVVVLLILGRRIFLPLLLGLAIAYVFDPAVSWLERKGLRRGAGVAVVALVLLLSVFLLLLYIVPTIRDQVAALVDALPRYRDQIRGGVEPMLERLQARYPHEIEELQDRAIEAARANLPNVAAKVGVWVGTAFGSIMGALLFLLTLVFVPVFAFYLLVDFPRLKQGLADLVPLPYQPAVLGQAREVDAAVASFLRGQLSIALILAAINAAGLMIIGVPLALVIGLVAGLANMIPYMALVVGLAPALLLSWAEDQSLARLVAIVAVFSGAQLLEGTFLSPRILGRSVNLHPVWVLLAIIVGGSLFGFIGMIVAVPAAAAITVFARHWTAAYKSSEVYSGSGDSSTLTS
jgi:predicted PurR-regulated permease PerM